MSFFDNFKGPEEYESFCLNLEVVQKSLYDKIHTDLGDDNIFINVSKEIVEKTISSAKALYKIDRCSYSAFLSEKLFQIVYDIINDDNFFKKDPESGGYYYNPFAWKNRLIWVNKTVITTILLKYDISRKYVRVFRGIIYWIIIDLINNNPYFKEVTDDKIANNTINVSGVSQPLAVKWLKRCAILDHLRFGKDNLEQISKKVGVNVKTVYRVRDLYAKNHFLQYVDLLEEKHGPAKKPFNKIPEKVYDELCSLIDDERKPREFGINMAGWSGLAVYQYLKKKHKDLDISLKYLYYFLERMGWMQKVAARLNPRRDEDEVKNFIEVEFKTLCREAKANKEMIIFADETHVQQGYGFRVYVRKKGQKAVAHYHQDNKHTDRTLLTFISPTGFIRIYCIQGTVDKYVFLDHLKKLKESSPGLKFLLILDNASVHKNDEVEKWLRRKNGGMGRIRVAWLPPNAPEINCVEYLNNDFKTYLKSSRAEGAESVVKKAHSYVGEMREKTLENKIKISNFSQAEGCKYIYKTMVDVFGQEYMDKSITTL